MRKQCKQTLVRLADTVVVSISASPHVLLTTLVLPAAYTPGWRKAGLPVKGSHLVLNHEQMTEGGNSNASLAT